MVAYFGKIVRSGLCSYTVALPKEWVERHKIKKGEVISIIEADQGLLISPSVKQEEEHKEKECRINIDALSGKTIQQEIIASYLNNYTQIVLTGETITRHTKDIKNFASKLVGVELIEEDSKKIILRCYLHLSDASPGQTLRRIDNILRSMLIDSKSIPTDPALIDAIYDRTESLNKFVHLMNRVLKEALRNEGIAKQLNLSPADILIYSGLLIHLGKISFGIKRYIHDVQKLATSKKNIQKMLELMEDFQKLYENAMKSFYTNDTQLADSVIKGQDILSKKCNAFEESINTIYAAHLSIRIKTMLTHVADITHLTRSER